MTERKRRKVLMIIPNLGYGGAERSFLNLKKLLEEHHDVLAVAFDEDVSGRSQAIQGNGFRYLGKAEARPRLLGRVKRWYSRFVKLKQLKTQHGSEVAISFLEGADILNILSRRAERTLVSIRGSKRYDPHIRGLQGFLRRVLIWPLIYPRADAVVGISAGVSEEVRSLGFVGRSAKLETIGLSLDVPALIFMANEPVEPLLMGIKDCPVIISWGRLSDEKGYQHLLRIFAGVKRTIPNSKLLLIGDGPIKRALIAAAEEMGLRVGVSPAEAEHSDLILLGYREAPIRYAKLARVFVLSSYAEGFGNAVVEAMAAGLPVLAADCPWGARSILSSTRADVTTPYPTHRPTHSEFGVLMPRIDLVRYEKIWVEEMVRSLVGNSQYEEYRRKGPLRARDFDVSSVAGKWLDIVERVASTRGPG